MLRNGIKFLKIIIVCELVILFIMGINACSSNSSKTPVGPSNQNKSPMRAFGEIGTAEVSKIEVYEMTITGVSFTKEDNTEVSFWTGTNTIDLAKTSYASTLSISGDLPVGTYKKVKLVCQNSFKVKGTLTINGTSYYTKTAHSGYSTGPAEVEELKTSGGSYYIEQTLSPSKQLGGAVSSIQFLVDIGGNLMYYSGVGDPPHPSITTGMNLYGMTAAVCVGTAGKVESYKISNLSTSSTPANTAGRYVFIFDGNDEVIGATTKFSFEDGKKGMDLYANDTLTVTKNSDGTLKIVLTGNLNGGPYTHTIDSFTRATHTGTFTSTMTGWSSPYSGGTYTATKE